MSAIKKAVFSLVLLLTGITIYSCANDTTVAPPSQDAGTYLWSTFYNGIYQGHIRGICIGDANTIYTNNSNECYKISNGVSQKINFGDSLFSPYVLDAYGLGYLASSGTIYGNEYKLYLKIAEGTSVTTALLGDSVFNEAMGIKIFSPGKIVVYTSNRIFIYDNGSVQRFFSPDSFSTNFNNLVQSGNAYYLSGYVKKIYKLENGSITTVNSENGNGEFIRMSIPGYILRSVFLPGQGQISYWNGNAWNALASDNVNKIYFSAAGETLNSMYFLAADTTSFRTTGIICAGGVLKEDTNYPVDNLIFYTSAMSNMKNNTIYIANDNGINTKIYKGIKN